MFKECSEGLVSNILKTLVFAFLVAEFFFPLDCHCFIRWIGKGRGW